MESEEVDQKFTSGKRVSDGISNENIMLCYVMANKLKLIFRNGTSMISLITPPKDQVSRINKMLADEYGTASNIKSRVNRYNN